MISLVYTMAEGSKKLTEVSKKKKMKKMQTKNERLDKVTMTLRNNLLLRNRKEALI